MIGFCWLALNLGLDLVLLAPMRGVTLTAYVYDIGLRYLLIPIMAASIGAVAERSLTWPA